MHRRTFLIAATALLGACTAERGPMTLAPNATLIVTRHGDRTGEDLSKRGRARARALVNALDGMELTAIFSPGIQRNLDTAAPLAQARNLPVHRLSQEAPTAALARAAAAGPVIWIGNKGNIVTIWEDLALPPPPPLDYGDLHIIRSDSAGRITIERRVYGPA